MHTFLNSTKNIFSHHAYDRAHLWWSVGQRVNMKLSDHAPFDKKNLQQMTRAILGTIIYLHSQNTIHVHFFHDEHFFSVFRRRRQQWSMQFFGKQSPQNMQKNPLTHKYYSPRSFFAIILPLKSLSWKNLI